MNEADVIALMETSTSDATWNANTRRVKEFFDGRFPEFWYASIIASGVMSRIVSRWGGSAEIHDQSQGSPDF